MAKKKSGADKGAPAAPKLAPKPAPKPSPKPAPDAVVKRPSVAPELVAAGRSVRKEVPRSQLGAWVAPEDRRDPVAILEEQAQGRVQDLVPLRYARMAASAFTFYRGAAALMANDLGTQDSTGLIVQLAGHAHLANFGGFATAERTLIFDLNDFDETLPGPFEWDVKRLVASFEVAGRHKKFSPEQRSEIIAAVASEYRNAMAEFAGMTRLDVWYARMQAEDIVNRWSGTADPARIASFQRTLAKGRKKTSAGAVSRYTTRGPDGDLRIISDPPFVEPIGELAGMDETDVHAAVQGILAEYRKSLPDDLKVLIDGYRVVDAARKVVGVGSVGTRCWIALLVGRDDPSDDLVLQFKEATASVLEQVAAPSAYDNHGRRVVEGQRLMQASSDMLLGWTRVPGVDGVWRDFYVRQMWDWKTSADLESMDHLAMGVYARVCGWTLARAHARSGNRYAIAAYLGSGRTFTRAMQEFADSYADQNQRDYEAFLRAIVEDRIPKAEVTEG
jgi:uncharacterized protein (DUF2252 family)